MVDIPFVEFPKIARFNREVIVTEKIDGTNAQILVNDTGDEVVGVGSRTRWISPKDDNHGFAGWVQKNKEELLRLGPGSHFGEWWGAGIQRTYGLKEKRFSLFNVSRWEHDRPACCGVVPVLSLERHYGRLESQRYSRQAQGRRQCSCTRLHEPRRCSHLPCSQWYSIQEDS